MSAHDDLMTALLVERFNGGGWKKPELTEAEKWAEELATMQQRLLLKAAQQADDAVVVEIGGAA